MNREQMLEAAGKAAGSLYELDGDVLIHRSPSGVSWAVSDPFESDYHARELAFDARVHEVEITLKVGVSHHNESYIIHESTFREFELGMDHVHEKIRYAIVQKAAEKGRRVLDE